MWLPKPLFEPTNRGTYKFWAEGTGHAEIKHSKIVILKSDSYWKKKKRNRTLPYFRETYSVLMQKLIATIKAHIYLKIYYFFFPYE